MNSKETLLTASRELDGQKRNGPVISQGNVVIVLQGPVLLKNREIFKFSREVKSV